MSKKINPKKPYYVYESIRQEATCEDLDTVITYGIRVSSKGKQVALISNVSTNETEVKDLAALCTQEQLEPIHLSDVIEDLTPKEKKLLYLYRTNPAFQAKTTEIIHNAINSQAVSLNFKKEK